MERGRVLVVDDEAGLLLTLAAILELEGFSVAQAASAEEALEILQAHVFDVILSDILMPGKSGIELAVEVRRDHPRLPVVLMTGFTEEERVRAAIQAGVFTVLSKPFEIKDVAATLTRAVVAPAVLVVDPEQSEAEAVADAVQAAGLEARTAASAVDAVDAVRRGGVGVCVVDLGVAKGPRDMVEQLRTVDPEVAVIAFVGRDDPDLLHSAAASGAYACMRKPLDPAGLLRNIAGARRHKAAFATRGEKR